MREATTMVGMETVITPNSAGTGPMYELCDRLGLPVVSGEGAVRMTCNAHSPNEHVFLEDWFRAIKQFAAFLDVYART